MSISRQKLGKNGKNNPASQILTPEATGLSQYQLNMLAGFMKSARRAFDEGKFDISEELCWKCINLYPSFAAPYAVLGNISYRRKNFEMTVEFLEKSLSIVPNVPLRLLNYSTALLECNRNDDALMAVEKCVAIAPKFILAECNRAGILVVLGRTSEAISIYKRLMEEAPLYGKPFHNISTLIKFEKNSEYSSHFEKLAQNIEKIVDISDLIDAHFALGTYYEGLEEYTVGFKHFLIANELISSKSNYDIDKDLKFMENNKIKFPKNGRWQKINIGAGLASVPIFIVGMPRSGTTLTEQVLAGHSQIFGAGELTHLSRSRDALPIMTEAGDEICPSDAVNIAQFENNVREASKKLVDAFISISPNSKFVIDKMPQNFLHLGYKHLLLPNAKIIHCKRNPVDTCLSNFRLLYDGKLQFTSNLENIGKYYVAYSRLMDHWKNVFGDRILEVHYEDTVDDLEAQARRITEFLGVEWDEACLNFHESKRSVNTASVNQVRQPIYRTSVGRYKRYGDMLRPLLNALAPVL